MKGLLALLITITIVSSSRSDRKKRFINGQQYFNAAEAPSYLARITRTNPLTNSVRTICSGSIIADNLVLTSGACLMEESHRWDKEYRPIPLRQLEVIVGGYDSAVPESTEQKRNAAQIYLHPGVKMVDHRRMWINDIAVIQLDEAFELGEAVQKIELWLSKFGVNATYTESYILVKASGYGGSGSRKQVQYADMFDTFSESSPDIPQYQFYSMKRENLSPTSCEQKMYEITDIEGYLATALPAEGDYDNKMASAKRCFNTGSAKIAPYMTTAGDWGGPITWESHDNGLEYQVFLTPWQPEERASFSTGLNYPVWGEVLTYYTDFLGYVMSIGTDSDEYIPTLTVDADASSITRELDLSFLNRYQVYVRLEVPEGKYAQVNITVTSLNAVFTTQNTILNIRNSSTNTILSQYSGEVQSQGSTVSVTDGSPGSQASYWGLSAKRKRQADGVPMRGSSIVFGTEWAPIFYNAENSGDLDLEFLVNMPQDASDKGSMTLTVSYAYTNVNGSAPGVSTCASGYKICDDGMSCIPESYICDRDKDCFDEHDETAWCHGAECMSSEFQCLTGECMKLQYLCDGSCDCFDKEVCEDETILCGDTPLDKNNVLDEYIIEEDSGSEGLCVSMLLLAGIVLLL